MSSDRKDAQSEKAVDIETKANASPIKKSDTMENSEKSDAHDTSGTSTDKKSVKRKKIKSSPSSSSHKKVKKDPNKPEYPKVGYVRYMNVRREELRKDSPDMHHLEVTKKIGEEWMALSDEKKQPYLDAAKEDKIRYKLEMKVYNKKLKKAEEEAASSSKSKKKSQKSSKDVNTSESTIDDSPKKKKKKVDKTKQVAEIQPKEVKPSSSADNKTQKSKTFNVPSAIKKAPCIEQQQSISMINTPPPTPPQIDANGMPFFGDIPIFTDKFLDHNRQMETELKKIRKLNTDYEQQNAVLEKHVENVRAGISKANVEIVEIRTQNQRLSSYLETLRKKLATQLRNLSIPSETNGANIDNIDKYMNDLYKMAKDNSHGPASLNKAKDLLRKVDLNIDLKTLISNHSS